jgi:hypothetical protein
MNGTSRTNTNFEPGDDGLEPDLMRLFDEAAAPAQPEAFVNAMWTKLAAARRARLIRRCTRVATPMVLAALLAPYVAQATVAITGWIAEQLPAAVLVIASCACATLIAWRTAHRQLD